MRSLKEALAFERVYGMQTLIRFVHRTFGQKTCMTKCPNCTTGACSKDVGHPGFHYCDYEQKPFSSE